MKRTTKRLTFKPNFLIFEPLLLKFSFKSAVVNMRDILSKWVCFFVAKLIRLSSFTFTEVQREKSCTFLINIVIMNVNVVNVLLMNEYLRLLILFTLAWNGLAWFDFFWWSFSIVLKMLTLKFRCHSWIFNIVLLIKGVWNLFCCS